MSTITLTGTIICVPEGNPLGGDIFYLGILDDVYAAIEFSHYKQVQEIYPSLNKTVNLTVVEEQQDNGSFLVPDVPDFFTEVDGND
jgi:hypothetical protein